MSSSELERVSVRVCVRAGVESEEEEEIDLSIYIVHSSIFYTRLFNHPHHQAKQKEEDNRKIELFQRI